MIYADFAATTPLDKDVLEKMLPFFYGEFANASSTHAMGRSSASYIENARKEIAEIINADKSEIYFSSGGTESDNWAIKDIIDANQGKHIITTQIEHHAVLNCCEALEKNGVRVTYLSVDKYGRIDLNELRNSITKDTALISVMTANNEIGTLQDINKIGEIAKEFSVPFHTDAVQAMGSVDIDVKKVNISLLSMSAHKFYGPKGIGVLYIKNGVRISNLIYGGSQERDRRAGTHNTPLIIGMAEALKKAYFEKERRAIVKERADTVKKIVLSGTDRVTVNGYDERLEGVISFSFEGIQAEGLVVLLDMQGICVSAGAACSAGAVKTSHVIKAIKKEEAERVGTIRVSLSYLTTEEEAECIGKAIVEAVKNLRG
ncbi:MAG: cysteine desulfurase [Clostridia bacterium]|nr:cysteine desulfurase [Clostridia bacterium]